MRQCATMRHRCIEATGAPCLRQCATCATTYRGGRSGGDANPLLMLAEKVRHLSPSHRDPERFHEDKSEIERDLRRLARRVGNG